MSARYKVVAGSQSGHCCFSHTVVDTTRPVTLSNGKLWAPDGVQHYEIVAECYDEADAVLIVDALNVRLPD